MIETDKLQENAASIVVPYSDAYEQAHIEFAAKMWPQKNRRRDPRYNRWKFRGPITGNVDGFLLAVVDGVVVGQLGVIPVDVVLDGKKHPAQWACDLMVDPAFRRQKIGSLLLAHAMSRDMITLGSDPSPAADAAMARVGFRPITGPWKMILPLEPENTIEVRLPPRLRMLAKPMAKILKSYIHFRIRAHQDQGSSIPVRYCSWEEVKPQIVAQRIPFPHIAHDDDFLRWRCEGLPGFSPELTAVTSDHGGFAVFENTPNQLYIYEWAAMDFRELQSLIQILIKYAMEQKSPVISIFSNTPAQRDWLSRMGFFTQRTPTKIIYYPEKLFRGSRYFHYCIYDSDGNL